MRIVIKMSFMGFMELMGTSDVAIVAAFFIGLMTAVSPCPLATNITAVAYISKRIGKGKHTILVGLIYTFGRMFSYTLLASLIVWFGLSSQMIALFLGKYGEKLLGPLLILIGLFMLNIIKFKNAKECKNRSMIKEAFIDKGLLGSFLLGVIFALAFCPFSGVLFFGMLIPLALKAGDGLVIPAVFAFATGLPVIIFSFIIANSISKLGKIMNKVKVFERWTRMIVGIIFVFVGAYYIYLLF